MLPSPSPLGGVDPAGLAESELTPAEFAFVRELVHRRAAIVLEEGKEYLATTRLRQVAQREQLPSVAVLLSQLRHGQDLELNTKVVEAMTTNETSFFRDLRPFEALRHVVLPELIERRRHQRVLRFWCGAASTGQEPYSVLMMLQEHFPQLLDWRLDFHATDLSTEVIQRAQAAVYTQFEVNRGLPAPLLVRHFEPLGGTWRLRAPLRQRVQFGVQNLIGPWPERPPQDIVFLRNVLIYFDPAAKRDVLQRVRQVLAPGGFLFLGGAESVLNLDPHFVPTREHGTTFYRLATP
jgi:chemotaxis protein methyltransferase CheR